MNFTHMPIDMAFEIMKEGHNLGSDRLHLTGGEVLLHPDFFKVLDQAVDLGFTSFFINTNGHLLDDKICSRLNTYPDLELTISLNGPEEHHNAIRGEGAHAKALKGLEAALSKKLRVHVFTVVNKQNLKQIPHFFNNLMKEYPKIGLLTLIQLRSGPEGESKKLQPEDYLTLVQTTALLGLAGLPVQILENPLSTTAALKMGHSHLPPSLPISREGRLFVFADGRIGDNHSTKLNFGKYQVGKLSEVLNSAEYNYAIREKDDLCQVCAHFNDCREGGLLQPSDQDHNVLPYEIPFCKKVMSLL